MKSFLARLAVKYLMPEIRKELGYPDPRRFSVKSYVHKIADQLAGWDNPDAVFYLSEWIDDYLEEKSYFERLIKN